MPASDATGAGSAEAGVVDLRQAARVTLRSGETVAGEISAVSDESITIGRPGNFGYEEREIAAGDIARLEVERLSRGTTIAAFTVVGALVLVAVAAETISFDTPLD